MTLDQGDSSFSPKIADKLVLCSDLHLLHGEDDRSQIFLSALNKIDCAVVEYLVLNGDIFDFCFGGHRDYFSQKFKPIRDGLEAVAKSGVRVILVQGNHEFALSQLKWSFIHFVEQFSHTITLNSGVTVAITHGDQIWAPWHYHGYRYIVRTRFFCWLASLLPPQKLDALALRISLKSRGKDAYRKLHHKEILTRAMTWLESSGAQYGIFGHFHTPYFYPPDKQSLKKVLCVESWDKPNFLGFDGKDFRRYYPTLGGDLFRVCKV